MKKLKKRWISVMSETFKITVSLINSYLYYKNNKNKTEKDYDNFVNVLKNVYTENKWTKRGTLFESEVYKNMHGKLSQLIIPLEKQVWCEAFIDLDERHIRLAGKLDALDRKNRTIYDIKRVDVFDKRKYDENVTVQHLFYFYLNPEVDNFYYLVVSGKDKNITGQHVVHKERPNSQILGESVIGIIKEFYAFLKDMGLLETYEKNWRVSKK